MIPDSESSCPRLRLEVKGSRKSYYVDVPISDILKTDIKVWELESIYLEEIDYYYNSKRTIGTLYRIKSDPTHYLTHLWLGGWDDNSKMYGNYK